MKRTRFTEEQIIGVLKEAEAGTKTADLAHWHGVSEATICSLLILLRFVPSDSQSVCIMPCGAD